MHFRDGREPRGKVQATLATNVSHDLSESRFLSRGPVSRLHDTSKQIQEISRYVCGQAEELVADEQNIYHLIHQIVQGTGLAQGGCDACERGDNPSAHIDVTDPQPDEETMQNRTFL